MQGRLSRRMPHSVLSLLITVLLVGCGGSERTEHDLTWRHEELMVEGVRTVRTTGGSVWGGPAMLVEEARIGSRDEPGPAMFGQIRHMDASDERIYVLDFAMGEIRVFDYDGGHMFSFSRNGAGPGEFSLPSAMTVYQEPGRVLLRDISLGRLTLFDLDGAVLETRPVSTRYGSWMPTVMMADGRIYVPISEHSGQRRTGMGLCVPIGATLDTIWAPPEPDTPRLETRRTNASVPFWPDLFWVMAPDGTMVHGYSAEYRIVFDRPDGVKWAVEREVEPIPALARERSWHRAELTARMRRYEPGWSWDAPPVPETKPAFERFMVDRSGRLWVFRPGPGSPQPVSGEVEASDYAPPDGVRWVDSTITDVFAPDGHYLGQVDVPPDLYLWGSYIRDDVIITVWWDVEGVQYVKRYRLVIPDGTTAAGSR